MAQLESSCAARVNERIASVVETVQQSHALVEVPLGEADVGRDRDMMVPQVGIERNRVTGRAGERCHRE